MQDLYRQLGEQFKASKGNAVIGNWAVLLDTRKVFAGNYRELIQAHKQLVDNLDEPWDIQERDKLQAVQEETVRLFFNFSNSAHALVEHTRTHMKRHYSGTAFWDEYKRKLALELASAPVQCFLKELRNYAEHDQLPAAFSSFKWTQTPGAPHGHGVIETGIVLRCDTLRSNQNWGSYASVYLDSAGDTLPLAKIAFDYFSLVSPFNEWLWQRWQVVEADSLLEYERLGNALSEMEESLYPGS